VSFSECQCGVKRYKRLLYGLEVSQFLVSCCKSLLPLDTYVVNYLCQGDMRRFHWQHVPLTHRVYLQHYAYMDTLACRLNQRFRISLDMHNVMIPQHIKHILTSHRKRFYAITLGPVNSVPFCTEPYSYHNLNCGLLKRITPRMPLANLQILDQLHLFVQKWLKEHLVPLPKYEDNLQSLFDWWILQLKHFNLKKKKILINSFKSLHVVDPSYGGMLNEGDYNVSCFVKREFYEEPKHLRYINSRSNRFKARVGPIIKKIEHAMYEIPYFVKGKIIDQLPLDIIKLKNYPYFLETDYSAFESGFSPPYTDAVECELFRYMLSNNPILLREILKVYAIFNHHFKPRVERMYNKNFTIRAVGTRMSGEMWTSLGNSFSNLMNMLFLSSLHNINVDGFVEGDDGLFGVDKPILGVADFALLGFNIKMKYVSSLEDTSFCGNVFSTKTCHSLVPPEQISRVFFSCSTSYLNVGNFKKMCLLRAKAASLFIQGKYTPIASILAYKILKLLGPGPMLVDPGESWWNFYILDLTKLPNFHLVDILLDDRLQYYHAFGIGLDSQLIIEKFLLKAGTIEELEIYYPLMNLSYVSGLY